MLRLPRVGIVGKKKILLSTVLGSEAARPKGHPERRGKKRVASVALSTHKADKELGVLHTGWLILPQTPP